MADLRVTMGQIVGFTEAIGEAVARGRPAFDTDPFVRSHVLHHLVLIGEAARRVRDELPVVVGGVPWEQVIGLRNAIVHGYDEVDAERLWHIAVDAVPALRDAVAKVLDAD